MWARRCAAKKGERPIWRTGRPSSRWCIAVLPQITTSTMSVQRAPTACVRSCARALIAIRAASRSSAACASPWIAWLRRLIRSAPHVACGFSMPSPATRTPLSRSSRKPATLVVPRSIASPNAGRRNRPERAAVERVVEGDQIVLFGIARARMIGARRLDRALDRFGARIGEEDGLRAGGTRYGELARQAELVFEEVAQAPRVGLAGDDREARGGEEVLRDRAPQVPHRLDGGVLLALDEGLGVGAQRRGHRHQRGSSRTHAVDACRRACRPCRHRRQSARAPRIGKASCCRMPSGIGPGMPASATR